MDENDGVIVVNGGPPAVAIDVIATGVNGVEAPVTQETMDGSMADRFSVETLIANDVTAPTEELLGFCAADPVPVGVVG